jgi:hypothetical protein
MVRDDTWFNLETAVPVAGFLGSNNPVWFRTGPDLARIEGKQAAARRLRHASGAERRGASFAEPVAIPGIVQVCSERAAGHVKGVDASCP